MTEGQFTQTTNGPETEYKWRLDRFDIQQGYVQFSLQDKPQVIHNLLIHPLVGLGNLLYLILMKIGLTVKAKAFRKSIYNFITGIEMNIM